MSDNLEMLKDLQEITFWHQLNRQLIDLRESGKAITSGKQGFIRDFCLKNSAFAKIRSSILTEELPMLLVSDGERLCFITANSDPWPESLGNLLGGICPVEILDLDQALADAFDAMVGYDEKFQLVSNEAPEEDADEELYEVMAEYARLQENQGKSFGDLVLELHALKGASLKALLEKHDGGENTIEEGGVLSWDLKAALDQEAIETAYLKDFCARAEKMARAFRNPLEEMTLNGFLLERQAQKDLNPATQQFISRELHLLREEGRVIDSFLNDVSARRNQSLRHKISICPTSPFAFLNNPFPTA